MKIEKLTCKKLERIQRLIKKIKKHAPIPMWKKVIVYASLKSDGVEKRELKRLDKYFE